MADYYTTFSSILEDVTGEQAEWLKTEIGKADGLYDMETDYSAAGNRFGFWVEMGMSVELDQLYLLFQRFLTRFMGREPITFTWANTCSKPYAEGFDGGAVLITADKIVTLPPVEKYADLLAAAVGLADTYNSGALGEDNQGALLSLLTQAVRSCRMFSDVVLS